MKKTIQKQFFTEDLSKYGHFLEASDMNIQASIDTMQQEIDVHKKIGALIKKFQDRQDITNDDLQPLVETSCPDFVTMHAFEKLNESLITSLDSFFDAPVEDTVFDCSKMKCETCWHNYINQMGRLLNQSFVDVKLYDPMGDEDDDDPDPET